MSQGFEYFDRIFVLNLDADRDRLLRIMRRFADLRLTFERYPAVQFRDLARIPIDATLKPGHFGCARSHQRLLQMIWERGYDSAVIFEDDAVFRDDVVAWVARIVPHLAMMPWDVFYLGSHVVRSSSTSSDYLIRVLEGYHTHAYAVSRKAISALVRHIERAIRTGRAFDGFEDPGLLKLCASPILAIQEPNYSHSLGCFADRIPQYFGPFDRTAFAAHCPEMRLWAERDSISPPFQ